MLIFNFAMPIKLQVYHGPSHTNFLNWAMVQGQTVGVIFCDGLLFQMECSPLWDQGSAEYNNMPSAQQTVRCI